METGNPAETDERIPDPLDSNHSNHSQSGARPPIRVNLPVRINADDQKKWRLLCYCAIFLLVIVFLSLVAALALPQALVPVDAQRWVEGTSTQTCGTHLQLVNSTITCADSTSNYTAAGAFVTNLSPLNQFLVLYLNLQPGVYSPGLQLNEAINLTLYSARRTLVPDKMPVMEVTGQISSMRVELEGSVEDVFSHGRFFLLYMSKLGSSEQFYWELKFSGGSQLRPGTYHLTSQIVNADFSYFAIFLRVGLFVVSFVVFVWFNRLVFRLPKERVSVEQRALQVLSVVTLTFNDQLYFISVIAPNPISSFLSSFFLWNFVAYLFMIWALFLNRIRAAEGDIDTHMITNTAAFVVFLFYAVVLGYSVAYAITQTTDHPVFSHEDVRSKGVIAMAVLAFLVFAVACVYIAYLFVSTLRRTPHRAYRHSVFMAISAAFFVATAVFFFVGGYDLYSYSASKIFFTLAFMNMYSYYLQYLYAPTQQELRKIKRENLPLVGPESIDIPECGEVLIEISEISEERREPEEERDGSSEGRSSNDGNLSARERRKRQRKLRNMNREEGNQGDTQEQIVKCDSDDIHNSNSAAPHNEDEFS